jgi:hypothetical protein
MEIFLIEIQHKIILHDAFWHLNREHKFNFEIILLENSEIELSNSNSPEGDCKKNLIEKKIDLLNLEKVSGHQFES